MLTEREKDILKYIVEEYISTAIPVGSSYLVNKFDLDLSPATVRNTMMELEKKGYIISPHISSGRVPTEKGYKFYISNEFVQGNSADDKKDYKKIANKYSRKMRSIYRKKGAMTPRDVVKCMAKITAEEVQNTVIVAFDKNDIYFTGISYLLSHPECRDYDLLHNISETIDRIDDILQDVLGELPEGLNIFIGSDNPFADDLSFIGFKGIGKGSASLVGVLGPMRMPYIQNIKRISFIKNFLEGGYQINF